MITGNNLLEHGFIITSNVVPKKNQGAYLWGHFMHGDADHYDDHELEVDSIEELEAILKYIASVDSRPQMSYGKLEEEFYRLVGEKWREENLWEWVSEWWPRDVTFDDIRAKLEKHWVVYVNEFGTEFMVTKL